MRNYTSLAQTTRLLTCLGISAMALGVVPSHSQATPVVVIKQANAIETSVNNVQSSAFFTNSPDNLLVLTNMSTAQTPGLVGGNIGAGDAASCVSTGSFTIVGGSTSAGGWVDSNAIPAGITLTFNIQFTTSTTNAGSFLTAGGNSGTPLGNGIGITPTAGAIGALEPGEVLEFSTIAVTGINFSGSLAEPGFSFSPGTVSNVKWNRLRSNNLAEATEGVTVTVGTDVWGFGTSSGNIASGLAIDNSYAEVTNTFVTAGPMRIETQAGTWNLKGVGFQYQVIYDIGSLNLVLDPPSLSGSNIILSGAGPASNTYSILSASTLTAPPSTWTTNTTGTFDGAGRCTNVISAGLDGQFFMLKTP